MCTKGRRCGLVFIPFQPVDNEVTDLLRRVAEIRDECAHEYISSAPFVLMPSRVRSVYLGFNPSDLDQKDLVVEMRCVKCDQLARHTVREYCPRCGTNGPKGRMAINPRYRRRDIKAFTGFQLRPGDGRVFECPACHLKIALRE